MTRVQNIIISFQLGRYDAEGHLLGEGPAPQQVVLYYPFTNITAEALQELAWQVEAAQPAGGGAS